MDIFNLVIILLICFLFCLLILWTYSLGLKNGQRLSKREDVILPEINPINVINNEIEKNKIKTELHKEQEMIDIMISNIDNYDGTGIGQKEIPNR